MGGQFAVIGNAGQHRNRPHSGRTASNQIMHGIPHHRDFSATDTDMLGKGAHHACLGLATKAAVRTNDEIEHSGNTRCL